jgi:exodeoxyribonuclease VII small subunit
VSEAVKDADLDGVLQQLEKVIAKLADGSAPLEELVSAHEEATRLVDEAQVRLRDLMRELDTDDPPQLSAAGRGTAE